MYLRWLGLGLVAALGWAAGCGGNVVVDSDGSGGAGGTTTTGPGGPTTGPGGPTTGPGGDPTICAGLCNYMEQHQCGVEPDCVAECLDFYATQTCIAELDAYFGCVLTYSTSCDLYAPECEGALNEYDQCVNGSSGCAGSVECYGSSDGSCGCKGFCNGTDVSVDCAPGPSGVFDCSCVMAGSLIAVCQEDVATCDIQGGCCAPYFFGFE